MLRLKTTVEKIVLFGKTSLVQSCQMQDLLHLADSVTLTRIVKKVFAMEIHVVKILTLRIAKSVIILANVPHVSQVQHGMVLIVQVHPKRLRQQNHV